jgi:hypothetical protein
VNVRPSVMLDSDCSKTSFFHLCYYHILAFLWFCGMKTWVPFLWYLLYIVSNQLYIQKSIIFWDMMPFRPLSFNWRFRGTYRLHLQGQRNKFSKNQQASRLHSYTFSLQSLFMFFLLLDISRLGEGKICY